MIRTIANARLAKAVERKARWRCKATTTEVPGGARKLRDAAVSWLVDSRIIVCAHLIARLNIRQQFTTLRLPYRDGVRQRFSKKFDDRGARGCGLHSPVGTASSSTAYLWPLRYADASHGLSTCPSLELSARGSIAAARRRKARAASTGSQYSL